MEIRGEEIQGRVQGFGDEGAEPESVGPHHALRARVGALEGELQGFAAVIIELGQGDVGIAINGHNRTHVFNAMRPRVDNVEGLALQARVLGFVGLPF